MSFQTRVVVGFLAICLALSILWWRMPTSESRTADRMKKVASGLPLGSTQKQMESALKNQSVEFVYKRVEKEYDANSFVTRAGYTTSDLSGYVVAYVHGTPKSIIGSCSVLRHFLFDKKGKLIKVLSNQGCIGL